MYSELIQRLRKKVQGEIDSGKIQEEQSQERMEEMCSVLEKRGKEGLLDFWNKMQSEEVEIPEEAVEEKPKKRGRPKGSKTSKPKAAKPKATSSIPSLVEKWAKAQEEKKTCSFDEAIEAYKANVENGVADYITDENKKIIELIMMSQVDLMKKTRSQSTDFEFLSLGVSGAYSFEGEGPVSPGSTIKIKKTIWKNSVYGVTTDDEHRFCVLTSWEKEEDARELDEIEPFQIIRGNFPFYEKYGRINLTFEDGDFEIDGEMAQNDVMEIVKDVNLETIDVDEISIDLLDGSSYKDISATGRVISIGDMKTTKSGKPYTSIKIGTNNIEKIIAGDSSSIYISVFNNPNTIYKFTPGQEVLFMGSLSEGKGDYKGSVNLNLRWIAPLSERIEVDVVN